MDSARKPEAKPPVTAAGIALKRLEGYFAEKLANQSDEAKWDFYTRVWLAAEKIPVDQSGFLSWAYRKDKDEAARNRNVPSGKRTYWKVEVEAYDHGAWKAAVTGSEERETLPLEQRHLERPGLTVTECWFASKDSAEAFVADLRRPGKDRATTDS
jgi:hypothetical protein